MYATNNDITPSNETIVIQMLSAEEERLVDLFSNAIVSITLKEVYEQKRDSLSEIQQQGAKP